MFCYDAAITARYATIRAGLVHATGLTNTPSGPDLLAVYEAEQRMVAQRLVDTSLAELPSIAAWRRVFSSFGAKPTQHRNAAESLLRRLTKKGDIPSISTLVDIGNLVSIRYAMPVAIFDLAGIAGPLTVRFATGDEGFTELGATDAVNPEPGEVVFVDTAEVVSARRWCWRQSAQSATSATTVEALLVVEGHHDTAAGDARAALADLTALLSTHQPDSHSRTATLSPAQPRPSWATA